ncbi:MAG: hypothetical protein IKL10_07010 [Clostridia bacterium]|nr:hypothetical protein [Clostridia bacterium]
MRKSIAVIFFILLLIMSGCALDNSEEESISESPETSTEANPSYASGEELSETENASTAQITDVSEEIPSQPEVTTSVQEKETVSSETVGESSVTEIDLTITMPEKNGDMYTDKSSDNKYIRIVCDERGLEPQLLVAVFAVPESGQNYVFEFNDEAGRDVDDIRRVYLINSDGKISGVAASNGAEKEKVSSVENWFCMNVLIKEIIYPAVEKDVR